MAVTNDDPRIAAEAGNGSKTAFDFDFKIFAAADLICYKGSAATPAVYTLGALGVDYTVAFDSDDESGTVTWVVAPINNGQSVIIGAVAQTQGTAYPREGALPAATQEAVADRVTCLVLEHQEKLNRALLQPLVPPIPDPISVDPPTDRRAAIYEDNGDGTWTIVPSDYDPDELINEVTILASAYSEGTWAARPATPSARKMYYATDTDELAIYIPTAVRWFTIG